VPDSLQGQDRINFFLINRRNFQSFGCRNIGGDNAQYPRVFGSAEKAAEAAKAAEIAATEAAKVAAEAAAAAPVVETPAEAAPAV